MNIKYTDIAKSLLGCLLFTSSCNAKDNLEWSFDASYRLRFEYLKNTFRSASARDDDQVVASRLLAGIKLNYDHFTARIEMQDSRAWLDNEATPLGTDDVNTLEPLQYWLGWESNQVKLRIGRQTLDIGSRRLVARNRFRNTLNAFSGIYGQLNFQAFTVQSFYFNPVQRFPESYADFDRNAAQIDRTGETTFKGIHVDYLAGSHYEVFYYDYKNQKTLVHRKTAGFRVSQLNNTPHGPMMLKQPISLVLTSCRMFTHSPSMPSWDINLI